MATSITYSNFSLQSPFRFYKGPPKFQRGPTWAQAGKRKVDTPLGSPFIDIDEIILPDPETNEGTDRVHNMSGQTIGSPNTSNRERHSHRERQRQRQ
jgi:hypothetical protein